MECPGPRCGSQVSTDISEVTQTERTFYLLLADTISISSPPLWSWATSMNYGMSPKCPVSALDHQLVGPRGLLKLLSVNHFSNSLRWNGKMEHFEGLDFTNGPQISRNPTELDDSPSILRPRYEDSPYLWPLELTSVGLIPGWKISPLLIIFMDPHRLLAHTTINGTRVLTHRTRLCHLSLPHLPTHHLWCLCLHFQA
jgi:hypothetical protein